MYKNITKGVEINGLFSSVKKERYIRIRNVLQQDKMFVYRRNCQFDF